MPELTNRAPAIVAPGNHDGVHLGHRALLRTARALAQEKQPQARVTALTFDPHPLALIAPERAPARLTTMARRAELLRAAGADDVVVQLFDRELSELSPEDFLGRLMARGAAGFVVGPDFRFGRERAGDVAFLERFAEREGLVVRVEPPVLLAGERVSSTAVRAALIAGDIPKASAMLGRVPELQGQVVQGDQRGRTIGFPTANLAPEPVLRPRDGVYSIIARVLDEGAGSARLFGIANLGVRPTLAAGFSVEAHLFDFDGDLYGKTLRVGFVSRVRDEQKFGSLPELVAQITRDCETSKQALGALSKEQQESLSWI
jgi:riboflavin kinase/FMN adenylyltransferase